MKKFLYGILAVCFALYPALLKSQEKPLAKQLISSTKADTWVAQDAKGIELITGKAGAEIRKDKYVGIFYFIWQGAHGYDTNRKSPDERVMKKLPTDTLSPYDITKILQKDSINPQYGPNHAFHYWGEPYFGYYLADDEWIIRKHAQMLSDAGVDVIILDVTNAAIYFTQFSKIAETYRKMRQEGQSTPQIAFIVNSAPQKTVARLYEQVYKPGLYQDLWFNWKGKPLLLAPPEGLTDETRQFFSHRQSWAWSKGQEWFADGKDKWPWLDHTPQSYGWHESKDKPEQISVAIAEHPVSNIGRSFHDGKEPEKKSSGDGLYFAEQWERALAVDPEFVFVTGWNEWVAMRFIDGRAKNFLGKPIEKGDTYFVDLYNDEYSRDAEPVKASFRDNYYYQLVNYIRKYKGARPIPLYKENKSIKIDGNFNDWKDVSAVFKDDKGDTFHRKHPGWGRIKEYTNTSGRNDIVETKVISDDRNVYFYVKTAEYLVPDTAANWMNLYLKTSDEQINWEGFNYLVNHKKAGNLLKYTDKKTWESIGKIDFRYQNNKMEIVIPKSLLGINEKSFTLDFKWTDNIIPGDAMLWLDQGDTAPNARFKYRYQKQ